MRLFFPLILLATPAVAIGAEAIAPPPEGEWWVQLIWAGVAALITVVVSPWLKSRADRLRAEAAEIHDCRKTRAWKLVEAYAMERTDARLRRDGYTLAKLVASGKMKDSNEIKAFLRRMGEEEKTELFAFWKTEFSGQFSYKSLYEVYGEDRVDQLIEFAANQTWGRIPGFEMGSTTDNLLRGGAKRLASAGLERGVNALIERIPSVGRSTSADDPEPQDLPAEETPDEHAG